MKHETKSSFKMEWKGKEYRIARIILNKNNTGGFTLPDFKYKVSVIKQKRFQ